MLVHVVDYGEFQVVIILFQGRDYCRLVVQDIHPVSFRIDDALAVVRIQYALHHDPVAVGCPGFKSCDPDFMEAADRPASESAEVIVFRPHFIVEMGSVVGGYLYP